MFNSYSFLSDHELKRYFKVFNLVSRPTLHKLAKFYVRRLGFPIPPIFPVNLIYHHFIGGGKLNETLPVVLNLREKNVHVILDYAAEDSEKEETFEKNLFVFLDALHFCRQHQIPFLAIKPSSLARKEDMKLFSSESLTAKNLEAYKLIKKRFFEIFSKAYELGISVLVDAEESWFQTFVDKLVWEGILNFNKNKAIVWNTVQLYRKDRLEFMENEIRTAYMIRVHLGYKLVRGAYHEQEINFAKLHNIESPVFELKEETDFEFNKAINLSLLHLELVNVMIATHNKQSIIHAIDTMEKYKISSNDTRVWFSQLYGMGDYITYHLANLKYNVAKYLPFAPFSKALPYLIRRLEENSSALSMAREEFELIKQEIEKRSQPSALAIK
ncbi:MAG: proline dehydrogenase family protein [Bacteroidales bacterium]|nr:proline dehydrogenase family protein [Bacteroidales bacterium]